MYQSNCVKSERGYENSLHMIRTSGKVTNHTIHREKCTDHLACQGDRQDETMRGRNTTSRCSGPLYNNAIRYSSFMIKDILGGKSTISLELPAPCPLTSRWSSASSCTQETGCRSHVISSHFHHCNPSSQLCTSPASSSSTSQMVPLHTSSPVTSIASQSMLHLQSTLINNSSGEGAAAINTCSVHANHSPPTRLTHQSFRTLPHSLTFPVASTLPTAPLSTGDYANHMVPLTPFDRHCIRTTSPVHLTPPHLTRRSSPHTLSSCSSSVGHFYPVNSSPGESSARTTSSNASESILICETDSSSTPVSTTGGAASTNGQMTCNGTDGSGKHEISPHSCASSSSLSPHHACLDGLKRRKMRRNRTVFTELQLMGLERRFDSQKYLSTPDRADLARVLGLTQLQVKTWYQVK